jgi:hypothetical protein
MSATETRSIAICNWISPSSIGCSGTARGCTRCRPNGVHSETKPHLPRDEKLHCAKPKSLNSLWFPQVEPQRLQLPLRIKALDFIPVKVQTELHRNASAKRSGFPFQNLSGTRLSVPRRSFRRRPGEWTLQGRISWSMQPSIGR